MRYGAETVRDGSPQPEGSAVVTLKPREPLSQPARPTRRQRFARPFHCDVVHEHDHVRIVPVGEIDMLTAPEVEAKVRELRRSGFEHVVLDLRETSFMDCTGLGVVLRLDAAAHADGARFELIAGPRAVQRLFELTRVLDRLAFRPPATTSPRAGATVTVLARRRR
jgi:anti-anti-sigma factor